MKNVKRRVIQVNNFHRSFTWREREAQTFLPACLNAQRIIGAERSCASSYWSQRGMQAIITPPGLIPKAMLWSERGYNVRKIRSLKEKSGQYKTWQLKGGEIHYLIITCNSKTSNLTSFSSFIFPSSNPRLPFLPLPRRPKHFDAHRYKQAGDFRVCSVS